MSELASPLGRRVDLWTPSDFSPVDRPVLNIMQERLLSGSQRGSRDDDYVVGLAIEGGGMRGIFSAGACSMLESIGMIDTVDLIVGTSAGALNGVSTAARQARMGSTNFEDIAISGDFFNLKNILRGSSYINKDYLKEEVIRGRKPYDEKELSMGPKLGITAVNEEDGSLEIFTEFEDIDDLMLALEASYSIPAMASPTTYKGKVYADGGLKAPVPFKETLDYPGMPATHVLTLRTQTEDYRKAKDRSRKSRLETAAVMKLYENSGKLVMAKVMEDQARVYDTTADELQERNASPNDNVYQITPDPGCVYISRTERSIKKMRISFQAGADAVSKAFGLPPTAFLWEPTLYKLR